MNKPTKRRNSMNKPTLFRKKPVVIEAIQFSTDPDENEGPGSVFAWLEAECPDYWYDEDTCHIVIPTLEGEMHACPGDWIIKGVRGEFYPGKPDIFEATYERVGLRGDSE